jgi:hypothetical protein
MCFQDWRIGRLIRSSYNISQFGGIGPSTIEMLPNQCRVGYDVYPDASTTGITLVLADDPSNTNILVVSPLVSLPMHVTIATHGDMPTKGGLFTSSSANIFMIIEYIAPENILTLGLEMLQREYPGFAKWKIGQ